MSASGVLLTTAFSQSKELPSAAARAVGTEVFLQESAPPPHVTLPLHAHGVTLQLERPPHNEFDVVSVPVPRALAGAAPRRIATYLAGRHCAMHALRDAGCAEWSAPIAQGNDGSPTWPAGFVGSISHTDRNALAVVAAADRVRSVGVDCERVMRHHEADGIADAVLPEIDQAELIPGGEPVLQWEEVVTVAFSAKESLYKCLRPMVGSYFDFSDAHVTRVDLEARRLTLRLVRTLAPEFVEGSEYTAHFSVAHGTAFVVMWLAAAEQAKRRDVAVPDAGAELASAMHTERTP